MRDPTYLNARFLFQMLFRFRLLSAGLLSPGFWNFRLKVSTMLLLPVGRGGDGGGVGGVATIAAGGPGSQEFQEILSP